MIEFPFDTTRAVTNMLLSGTLARHLAGSANVAVVAALLNFVDCPITPAEMSAAARRLFPRFG